MRMVTLIKIADQPLHPTFALITFSSGLDMAVPQHPYVHVVLNETSRNIRIGQGCHRKDGDGDGDGDEGCGCLMGLS